MQQLNFNENNEKERKKQPKHYKKQTGKRKEKCNSLAVKLLSSQACIADFTYRTQTIKQSNKIL